MFVGKATNGWLYPTDDINDIFPDHGNGIFNKDDQMRWVDDRRYYSESAFWRVIKKTSESVYGQPDWYNYVAWSNLYKIGPEEGNPSGKSMLLQRELCIEVLKKEIEILSPKYIVFLTSGWEASFLQSMIGSEIDSWKSIAWGNYSCEYITQNGATYIKTKHPQSKPESSHIEAISKIIKSDIV